MQKIALIASAIFGLTGIALGALGAHALKKILTPDLLKSYSTGTEYQIYHALFLLFLSLPGFQNYLKYYDIIIYTAIGGVICFSGSIYLLTLLKLKAVALVTPLGGILFIISWGLLLLSALRIK